MGGRLGPFAVGGGKCLEAAKVVLGGGAKLLTRGQSYRKSETAGTLSLVRPIEY